MGWTAGADVSTGDLITAATWNNYLGASGSIEHLYDNSAVVKLTTRGDLLFRDASAPARLAKGTQYNVLRQGTNDPEWMTNIKELWVPATLQEPLEALELDVGVPVALLDTDEDIGYVTFRCPSDFNAILSAELITLPQATQANADWDIFALYGAVGEAFTTHSESDTATTYNATDNNYLAVDVSGILSSLAAGDIVALRLQLKTAGHDVGLVGFYMTYTS